MVTNGSQESKWLAKVPLVGMAASLLCDGGDGWSTGSLSFPQEPGEDCAKGNLQTVVSVRSDAVQP